MWVPCSWNASGELIKLWRVESLPHNSCSVKQQMLLWFDVSCPVCCVSSRGSKFFSVSSGTLTVCNSQMQTQEGLKREGKAGEDTRELHTHRLLSFNNIIMVGQAAEGGGDTSTAHMWRSEVSLG